jgi:hypothetical protein
VVFLSVDEEQVWEYLKLLADKKGAEGINNDQFQQLVKLKSLRHL